MVTRAGPSSCSRTSVVPGWVDSTPFSRETRSGTQRLAGQRDRQRPAGTLAQIRDGELHRDEPGNVLPLVDPGLDQHDLVLDELVGDLRVGLREEQGLDAAVEIFQLHHRPRATGLGDLAGDARR